MKYLFVLLVLVGCNRKEPDTKVTYKDSEMTTEFKVEAGRCYRYPNIDNQDVNMKVEKTYSKGGFLAEFIIERVYFRDVHQFKGETRHVKEIDCEMYDDLKQMSKQWTNG